jgi:hypothetical protein
MADLGGHLAAHSHPLSSRVNVVDDAFEKAQESGMQHIGKFGSFRIVAIRSQKILVEIIRAQAEEIHFGAELIQNKAGRWHLNHHADWNLGLEGDPSAGKIIFCFRDRCLELENFVERRNHGRHDLNPAER